MKVVILEDEDTHRQLIVLLLRRSGFQHAQFIEKTDGDVALALAIEQHPDLILSDLAHPGLDGIELVRRLRENAATASTPIVIVSARRDELAREAVLDAGANALVHKNEGIDPALVDAITCALIEMG